MKLGLALYFFLIFLPASVIAQPRFAIELGFGQSGGLTTYIDNIAYVQDDSIFLVNEMAGSGFAVGASFVFDTLEIYLDGRWFGRDQLVLHHQGSQPFTDTDSRTRPNGTIDDAGVEYLRISERRLTVPDRSRGDLLLVGASGGYRWYLLKGDVDLFIPISAGLVMTHILQPSEPFVFGLQSSIGFTALFELADPVSLFANLRLHGVLTPSYRNQDDVARASVNVGESTFSSVVSTMLYTSIGIGFQVAIR